MSKSAASTDGKARKALAQNILNAAKAIEDRQEEFACYALEDAGVECKLLEAWFKKDALAYGEATSNHAVAFAYFANAATASDSEDFFGLVRDTRIVALCLLAAMVEAGDA